MHITFVTQFPEDGRMSGRIM